MAPMTSPQPSWRDQRRLDRQVDAQIARDDRAAQAQVGIAAAEAAARLRRENLAARQAGRRTARKQAAARRAERVAWVREHVTDLLFVPVIAVPAALAWTGMSAYGSQLYGQAGIALPAFSEGAMWAFAGATTIRLNLTARDGTERPVWHLRAGTAVFAVEGGVLNFLHGLSSALGHLAGPVTGAVMALISVAGVVAHQLITAGPRRSRAARAAARTDRAIARRERTIRRIAVRSATAVLDVAGNARLVHTPGVVTVTRRRGRVRLEPASPARVWLPWPMILPGTGEPTAGMLADVQAGEAMAAYHGWRSAHMTALPGADRDQRGTALAAPARPRPASVVPLPVAPQMTPVLTHAERRIPARSDAPQTSGATRPATASNGASKSASNRASKPAGNRSRRTGLRPSEKRAKAERLLRDNPGMSTAELVEHSGVSKATADRIRAQAPARLRVAK